MKRKISARINAAHADSRIENLHCHYQVARSNRVDPGLSSRLDRVGRERIPAVLGEALECRGVATLGVDDQVYAARSALAEQPLEQHLHPSTRRFPTEQACRQHPRVVDDEHVARAEIVRQIEHASVFQAIRLD